MRTGAASRGRRPSRQLERACRRSRSCVLPAQYSPGPGDAAACRAAKPAVTCSPNCSSARPLPARGLGQGHTCEPTEPRAARPRASGRLTCLLPGQLRTPANPNAKARAWAKPPLWLWRPGEFAPLEQWIVLRGYVTVIVHGPLAVTATMAKPAGHGTRPSYDSVVLTAKSVPVSL